jgi:radical SAM protein
VDRVKDPATARRPDLTKLDFDQAPFIVIWEVTRACDLACIHCRAEAVPDRSPAELNTGEGFRLLEEVRRFGQPLVVLTGGDPLKRPDVFDLVRHGDRLGLRMTMTPSGTPLMTRPVLERAMGAGLRRLAVSLDGSTAARHDAFRQVSGSFDWSVKMLSAARDIGLPTQVNTTITRFNVDDVDSMGALVESLGISLWSVFFLVPTGRGRPEDEVSAEDYERVFARMYELAKGGRFDVKATAAPHYRRYVLEQQVQERRRSEPPAPRAVPIEVAGVGRAARSVNDGNGFVFVSHTGDICPSGFLPLAAGNVRRDSLVDVYRNSRLFRELRDYALLKGKCGVCPYRSVCGGSRARAYAMTGDYMESEPFCAYVPPEWQRRMDRGEALPPGEYFRARSRWQRGPDAGPSAPGGGR